MSGPWYAVSAHHPATQRHRHARLGGLPSNLTGVVTRPGGARGGGGGGGGGGEEKVERVTAQLTALHRVAAPATMRDSHHLALTGFTLRSCKNILVSSSFSRRVNLIPQAILFDLYLCFSYKFLYNQFLIVQKQLQKWLIICFYSILVNTTQQVKSAHYFLA